MLETKKICVRCKLEKLIIEFIKDNRKEDGRGSCCLECHRKAEKRHANTLEGKAQKKKSDTIYRQNNREEVLLDKKLYVPIVTA